MKTFKKIASFVITSIVACYIIGGIGLAIYSHIFNI